MNPAQKQNRSIFEQATVCGYGDGWWQYSICHASFAVNSLYDLVVVFPIDNIASNRFDTHLDVVSCHVNSQCNAIPSFSLLLLVDSPFVGTTATYGSFGLIENEFEWILSGICECELRTLHTVNTVNAQIFTIESSQNRLAHDTMTSDVEDQQPITTTRMHWTRMNLCDGHNINYISSNQCERIRLQSIFHSEAAAQRRSNNDIWTIPSLPSTKT